MKQWISHQRHHFAQHAAEMGVQAVSGSPTGHHKPSSAVQGLRNSAVAAQVSSAYVHLPFCKRRCFYCDFPVTVLGSKAGQGVPQGMLDYVQLLESEIACTPSQASSPLETVFFGGGTPSLIPPQLLSRILQALDKQYSISSQAEISMEADPGTFDTQRLKAYMQLGVNRFSVGVQSFQEELLKACGRSHTLLDVHTSLDYIQQAGVPNWSLDLISGLPHLTIDMWQESLSQAAACAPDHISVYDLQVEDKTPFARWYEPRAAPLPSDESAADMFRLASSLLHGAGFEHYEISSYARAGRRCRHNQAYWLGHAFYGFGLGATSHLGNARLARPRTMPAYRAWVMELAQAGHLPAVAEEESERLLDAVMLRLRMSDGLNLDWLAAIFGTSSAEKVLSALKPHIRGCSVLYSSDKHYSSSKLGNVRLTDPEGFLVSNDIISDIFVALDERPEAASAR